MDIKKFKQFSINKSKVNFFIPFLIIAVYLFIFFIPELKKLFLNLAESARVKAKIVKTEKDWANIAAFKKQISQLNEKIDYYEKRLPDEKEIPAILEFLSFAAKKMDVRITEIKPVDENKAQALDEPIYYKVPILLKAECGYHQFGRFLNELESADRFMKISELKLVANPRQRNIHYVQLTVVTYVMKK